MKIAEIIVEQDIVELFNLPKPQLQQQQRNRTFVVQPDSVKSAQRVRKLKTDYAVTNAQRQPTEIEKVLGMWQARDLQKQANANQAAATTQHSDRRQQRGRA